MWERREEEMEGGGGTGAGLSRMMLFICEFKTISWQEKDSEEHSIQFNPFYLFFSLTTVQINTHTNIHTAV